MFHFIQTQPKKIGPLFCLRVYLPVRCIDTDDFLWLQHNDLSALEALIIGKQKEATL